MFSRVFLAMTPREMEEYHPEKLAYMACHFSPYGTGLSNLPPNLPKDSVLLLDDSMPVQGHDPQVVVRQLNELVNRFSVSAVLLDFQTEKNPEGSAMVSAVLQALPCPAAVTKAYAASMQAPVFLPPPPVNIPLQRYLAPWLKQGVYLEIAPEAKQITVTAQGSQATPVPPLQSLPHKDNALHCHYNVEVSSEKAVFTIQRTKEDLDTLTQEAYRLGIRGAIGLYQELSRL